MDSVEPEDSTEEMGSLSTEEIPGRYVPEQGNIPTVIGQGGLGRVLVYRDRMLGRLVARKELLPSAASQRTAFLKEARVTAQLEHPNIVPVHEQGLTMSGQPYYTMKWVRGRSLEEVLASAEGMSERLQYLSHFVDMCQAVAYAHSRGVIHRDLKPQNVMVGEFGETVLLDWGLARAQGGADLHGEVGDLPMGAEQSGLVKGTPAYMSPEQARGENRRVDHRADIWALGAILFRILTGTPPYGVDDAMKVLARAAHEPLPSLLLLCPDAPPELVAIAERALHRDPDQRYAAARDMVEDLEAWQNGAEVKVYAYSLWELWRRFAARNQGALRVGMVALAILSVVVIGATVAIVDKTRLASANLARAYTEQAVSALERMDLPAAREGAVKALGESEQSVARGVLMASTGQWVPLLLEKIQVSRGQGPVGIRQLSYSNQGWLAVATTRNFFFWTPGGYREVQGSDNVVAARFSGEGQETWMLTSRGALYRVGANGGRAPQDFRVNVQAAALSTRGAAFIVTDHSMERWEPSGRQRWSIEAVTDPREDIIVLSPDERTLAWGHRDGTLNMVDAVDGRVLAPLPDGWPGSRAIAFSADGKLLATGGVVDRADHRVRVWSLHPATERLSLEGHEDPVSALAFSPDGKLLVSGGIDWTLRFWEISTGRLLAVRRLHGGRITALAFSQDGRRLASATSGGEFAIWEMPERIPPALSRDTRVQKAVFSGDGRLLLTSSGTGEMLLTQLSDGAALFRRAGEGAARLVALNRDGTILAWSNPDREQVILRNQQGDVERALLGLKPAVMALSPDGGLLVTGRDNRGLVEVWEETGARRWSVELSKRISRVAFSPDGQIVAITVGSSLYLLRASDETQIGIQTGVDGAQLADWGPDGTLAFSDAAHRLLLLSPGGGSSGGPAGEPRPMKGNHNEMIHQACFLKTDEGSWVVSVSRDRTLRVWDRATGREQAQVPLGSREMLWIGCNNSGQVAGASTSGEVFVWDAGSIAGSLPQLRAELEESFGVELSPRWQELFGGP